MFSFFIIIYGIVKYLFDDRGAELVCSYSAFNICFCGASNLTRICECPYVERFILQLTAKNSFFYSNWGRKKKQQSDLYSKTRLKYRRAQVVVIVLFFLKKQGEWIPIPFFEQNSCLFIQVSMPFFHSIHFVSFRSAPFCGFPFIVDSE